MTTYYDRFEGNETTKKWDKVAFRAGKVVQSAELNEIQSVLNYKIKQMGSSIWDEGDIITGCGYASVPGSASGYDVSINAGLLYIDGAVRVVPASTTPVAITGIGEEFIGVEVTTTTVTENEDATLRDPAVGMGNYGQAGSHRTVMSFEWKLCTGDGTDGIVPIITLLDGTTKIVEHTSEYSDIVKILQRRTYDESGNYTVSEFPNTIEWKLGEEHETVILALEKGKAYVEGAEIEIPTTRKIEIPVNEDYDTVAAESLEIYANTQRLYELDLPFVKKVNQLSSHVTGTVSMTRGSGSVDDILSAAQNQLSSDITSLVDIRGVANGIGQTYDFDTDTWAGASTVFSETTDWLQSGAYIDWSPPGSEPGYGTTYKVACYFDKVMNKGTRTKTTVFNESVVKKGLLESPATLTISAATSGSADAYYVYKVTAITALGETTPVVETTVIGDVHLNDISRNILVWTPPANAGQANIAAITGYRIYRNVVNSTNIGYLTEVSSATLTYTDDATDTLLVGISPPSRNTTDRDALGHSDLVEVTLIGDTINVEDYVSKTDYTVIKGNNPGITDVPSVSYATTIGLGIIDWIGLTKPSAGDTFYVSYTYWAHTVEGDYVCADSYSDFSAAPVYYNSSNGTLERLTNYIDFRTSGTHPRTGSFPLANYDYYLGKVCLIYLTSAGDFVNLTSTPTRYPVEPAAPDRVLPITYLIIPPYIYSPSEITRKPIQTKRYTMLDIRGLERRIEQLEYYQAVDILDSEAITTDVDSLNPKRGIFTDLFTGHGKGDVYHADYLCSIDSNTRTLRLPFTMSFQDSTIDLANTTAEINNKVITLPYSSSVYISQPMATDFINVNPYDIFDWVGTLTLSPDNDSWIDTTTLPDLHVSFDGNLDNYKSQTVWSKSSWGEWKRLSTGMVMHSLVNGTLVAGENGRVLAGGLSGVDYDQFLQELSASDRASLNGTYLGFNATRSERVGTTTSATLVPELITKSIGDRVLDVSKSVYIRAKTITVSGIGFRPSHSFKLFFDGVEMDIYTTAPGDLGSTGNTSVTSTSGGVVVCKFDIPAATFKTGTKKVSLTSADGTATSFGESNYTAEGLIQTKQNTFITVVENRLVISETSNVETKSVLSGYSDPLAQTFLTDDSTIAIPAIDLYFKTKDASVPITVQIRETVNGYPGKTVLGECTKSAASVNVSDTASIATTFVFTDPVTLNPNTEYSFVIYTPCTSYNIWMCKLGDVDVTTGERVLKQPYAGVMFSSANGYTWTADQTGDIKFTLYRCVFDNSAQVHFTTMTGFQAHLFVLNSIQTMPDGTYVRWSYSLNNGLTWVPFEPLIDNILTTVFTSVKLKADFSSTNINITPLVNADRFGFIAVGYDLSGSYVSRRSDFDNPSSEIHVYLDQALNGQNIEVAIELDDSGEFLSLGPPTSNSDIINDDNYTEAYWNKPFTSISAVPTYTNDYAYTFYYETTTGKSYYGDVTISGWKLLDYINNGQFSMIRPRINMSSISKAITPMSKRLRVICNGA